MANRFKVVGGSQSCHCCFVATVVDTTLPVIIGGKQYENQFEPICECFDEEDAERIAAAMNGAVQTKNDYEHSFIGRNLKSD